jgi:hypothetical protein
VAVADIAWHPDGMPEALTWRNGADQELRSHRAITYDAGAQRVAEDVSPLQPEGTTTARAATYGYDPYGVTTETTSSSVVNPWRYTDQYQDVSSGLYKEGAF